MLTLWKILYLGFTFTLVLTGREVVEAQVDLPATRTAIANPKPVAVDPIASNAKHEILMAIFDSGTDYNHPVLVNNIHYKIENGSVTGAGYDFVSLDSWPSPYISRSDDINPGTSDAMKGQALRSIKNTKTLLSLEPNFSKFLDPLRNHELENGLYHGTHVAALMVYDEPRLGLIPYKVFPILPLYEDGKRLYPDQDGIIFRDKLQKALYFAALEKVRVINISITAYRSKHLKEGRRELETLRFRRVMKQFEDFAEENPQILIVAATGNDGGWIDHTSRIRLPCGLDAPNVLCVGALDYDEDIAPFSNILVNGRPMIFAAGYNIYSARPTKICDTSLMEYLSREDVFEDKAEVGALLRALSDECMDKEPFVRSHGASMASPLVARVAGKILLDNPELTGAQVIDRIMAKGRKSSLGPLPIVKLRVEKPSWYVEDEDDTRVNKGFIKVSAPRAEDSSKNFEFTFPAE